MFCNSDFTFHVKNSNLKVMVVMGFYRELLPDNYLLSMTTVQPYGTTVDKKDRKDGENTTYGDNLQELGEEFACELKGNTCCICSCGAAPLPSS